MRTSAPNLAIREIRRWSAALPLLAATGCFFVSNIPEQSQFESLETQEDSRQAVARLYAAPLIPGVAVHPWFVIKSAEEVRFERWEVWPGAAEPFGHVRVNLIEPSADLGAGESYVLAELVGIKAEPVVEFIRVSSPGYACADRYVAFPGPNSSTYAQWVLGSTDWNIELPPTAIGRRYPPICP